MNASACASQNQYIPYCYKKVTHVIWPHETPMATSGIQAALPMTTIGKVPQRMLWLQEEEMARR